MTLVFLLTQLQKKRGVTNSMCGCNQNHPFLPTWEHKSLCVSAHACQLGIVPFSVGIQYHSANKTILNTYVALS